MVTNVLTCKILILPGRDLVLSSTPSLWAGAQPSIYLTFQLICNTYTIYWESKSVGSGQQYWDTFPFIRSFRQESFVTLHSWSTLLLSCLDVFVFCLYRQIWFVLMFRRADLMCFFGQLNPAVFLCDFESAVPILEILGSFKNMHTWALLLIRVWSKL